MIAILDNADMTRGLNWTLLGDSLYAEMDKITATRRIRPKGSGFSAFIGSVGRLSADALFTMHGTWRPAWPFFWLSMIATPKIKAAWFVDPFPYTLKKTRAANALLRMDLAFIPYREAYDELRAGPGGKRYVYLPYAADTQVFRDTGQARDIDILWMGRKDAALHEALVALSERHGLVYKYRENTGFLKDPRDLGALAARARYFVVTPPTGARSGGYSPLVMRYIEGLCAGCRLLGTLPASGEFEAMLPRRAVLEVRADGSDLEARYLADQQDTEAWAITREAAATARAEHGWDSRARAIVAAIEEAAARKAAR